MKEVLLFCKMGLPAGTAPPEDNRRVTLLFLMFPVTVHRRKRFHLNAAIFLGYPLSAEMPLPANNRERGFKSQEILESLYYLNTQKQTLVLRTTPTPPSFRISLPLSVGDGGIL